MHAWHAMETNEKNISKALIDSVSQKNLSLVLYNFYLSSLGSLENCNWELRLKFLTLNDIFTTKYLLCCLHVFLVDFDSL